MKREEQVRRVLRVLKPHDDLAKDCTLEVENVLGLWGFDGGGWGELYELPPKQKKEAARRFRMALARVMVTSKAFPEGTEMFGPLDVERDELLSSVQKFIKKCDAIIDKPSGPPKRSAKKKRWAAQEAMLLVLKYHTDSRAWVDLDTTICTKVAAVLYGDLDADLRPYVRELKKPGAK